MGALTKNTHRRKKRTFSEWIKSRDGQKVLVMVAFMVVPLILLAVFTYIPFGEMVNFSFYNMKYIGARKFVGLKNYAKVFSRDDCFGALKLSLYYMGGSVVQLSLALYLATLLSFKVKGGNIFKGFMFFPFLINGIAIGFIFKFFYTRGFVFDTVLQWCGFELENFGSIIIASKGDVTTATVKVGEYYGTINIDEKDDDHLVITANFMGMITAELDIKSDSDTVKKNKEYKETLDIKLNISALGQSIDASLNATTTVKKISKVDQTDVKDAINLETMSYAQEYQFQKEVEKSSIYKLIEGLSKTNSAVKYNTIY